MRKRQKLAYFSPLPPMQSGISDYSIDLLPYLSRHYVIDVVVDQEIVNDAWSASNSKIIDYRKFGDVHLEYDMILYHFGNSEFHTYMFDCLDKYPGVVILHDFFLSSLVLHEDIGINRNPGWLPRTLFRSHGWEALAFFKERYGQWWDIAFKYPTNIDVLQSALGVIVHSRHAQELARLYYGEQASTDWAHVPLPRNPAPTGQQSASRRRLGLHPDDFIVCSFGGLGPTKLNKELLAGWLASPLAHDPHCRLVFVGGGGYITELCAHVDADLNATGVHFTGRVGDQDYQDWLAAADLGVQLRCFSRGETSAAALDCMNYGMATIVNAHGSFGDLPDDVVWKLDDDFTEDDLVQALVTLHQDGAKRAALGAAARTYTHTYHSPRFCAEQYASAINAIYEKAAVGRSGAAQALAVLSHHLSPADKQRVAQALIRNAPPHPRPRQLLLDISEIIVADKRTGIERVVRALVRELLLNPPAGFLVEPVYATPAEPGYRYARAFTGRLLGIEKVPEGDHPVEAWPGDVFVGLDWNPSVVWAQAPVLDAWRNRGVKVVFAVYDLLPVLMPHVFPPGADQTHGRWLDAISKYDGVVCISKAIADEYATWLDTSSVHRHRPFALNWFHLGADVESSAPSMGMPENAAAVLEQISSAPTFLMVGTIEPRKGYLQTLEAFTQLWEQGQNVNLVIVGHEGWKAVPHEMRRTVPEIVDRLRHHPELGHRLFWLEGISDEYLDKVYSNSVCLIAASEGEGFGLPLVEAAQHGLPILVRDIPVFREVAGNHAYYFADDKSPKVIADTVTRWLTLRQQGRHPRSTNIPWLTWKQSAQSLADIVCGGAPYKVWKGRQSAQPSLQDPDQLVDSVAAQ